ncbi:DMT family transporter [Sabulicella glaciei]|uniref:DMT family transporter n=1 Tax=Sabulicella glaciei TaxID=2984948 RepID=A0ABT3NW07_9PROT|nr:DMT family transporter [Roseococcus sp. MDT2-1-1]MCW8085764.1 DMT family transporter [Roseococcus sp. MDT2-1-1]
MVLRGILLQLGALLIFVAMDTSLKWLTAGFNPAQIIWGRFLFAFLAVSLFFTVTRGRLPWRSRAPRLQALRSLILLGCSLLFTMALARIPLADATAVGFASPLLTVALAALVLRERVGARRWLGVALGFAGVLVALRPPFLTGTVPDWGYLLPLGTAFGFAWYQILTRRLAGLDNARVTILHTSLAATLGASLLQPFVFIPPSAAEWALLVAVGTMGALGHGLLVLAHARAPASILAPLSYSQLVWATLAGVVVFGDSPDGWTLLGAVVIAVGGLLAAAPSRPKAAGDKAAGG